MISFSVHPVARTVITAATEDRQRWAGEAVKRMAVGDTEIDRAYDEYLLCEALGLIPMMKNKK